MKRKLFLKILFRYILKYSVYLFGLVLLLSIIYPIIAYKAGNSPAIFIIAFALLLAGLVYYLANRPVTKEDINKDSPLFTQDLLQLLKRKLDKEELKPELEFLLNKYQKAPLLRLWQDLKYHLGLFKPSSHDYRFKSKVYSFDEGISYYIERLEMMLRTGHFIFNENESIYELYLRWLFYEGEYIEIEHIDSWYTYDLFKDVSKDDYYFQILFGAGISSSYETRKVSDINLKMTLKTAIQKNDKGKINQISQILKNFP